MLLSFVHKISISFHIEIYSFVGGFPESFSAMQMLLEINQMQVLEPNCKIASSRPVESIGGVRRSLEENYEGFLAAQSDPALWCRVMPEFRWSLAFLESQIVLSCFSAYFGLFLCRTTTISSLASGQTIRKFGQLSEFERYIKSSTSRTLFSQK